MIRSDRYFPSLSIFAISLLACGFGCTSESGSNYQNFNEIEESGAASSDGDRSRAADDVAAAEPLRAPRPEIAVISSQTANGTNEAGELIPLVAEKPTVAQLPVGPGTLENLAPEVPREIKLLVSARSFRKEDGALRVSYDDLDLLKILNMQPVPPDAVSYFPEWLTNLDGQRVRIRGFMMPPFRNTEITGFVMARDNQICCMGKNPKIYDLITVQMRKGVTTDYILNRPFDVVGTFHIDPFVEDGEWFDLYAITDAVVIDK